MHSYLVSSLGNCAHKTPTETDVINVLEPVNFALLTAGSKCSAEAKHRGNLDSYSTHVNAFHNSCTNILAH